MLAPAKSLAADSRWEVVYRLTTGAASWWESINDGRIALRTDSGIIKAVYSSGTDGRGTLDSCKFEDAWGQTLNERLWSDRDIGDKQYKLGRQVAYLYALDGSRRVLLEAAIGRSAD